MFQDIAPHKFDNHFYKDAIRPEDVVNGAHMALT